MTDRFERLRDLVLGALDVPADRRSAWILEACGDDTTLRDDVESLLALETPRGSALRTGGAIPAPGDARDVLFARDRIGSYEILDVIAEREDARIYRVRDGDRPVRPLALKLFVARAERPPARVSWTHPTLVLPLDTGLTTTGAIFLVREFVRGLPITEYADQVHLPIRDRLEVARDAAQALEVAHGHGLFHGHVCPSNLLIAREAGTTVTRIVDFGLDGLRAASDPGDNALPPDARLDVRAFGTLLHELLTGEPPDVRSPHGTPPSGCLRGGEASGRARCRRTSLAKWRGELVGDVDRIVLRCLDPEPGRAYSGMAEVAADLGAMLEARRPHAVSGRGGSWARFLRRLGGRARS